MIRLPAYRLVATSVVSLLVAGAARAQVAGAPPQASAPSPRGIGGVVRDSAGAPIAAADIRFGATLVRSDGEGRFVIKEASGDSIRVLVRKLGYEPTVATLHRRLAPSDTPDVVTLLPLVARLDRVVVKGVPYDRRLWESGFYRRQRGPGGKFFDGADVRFLTASGSLAPLLRSVSRVEVQREGNQDVAITSAGGAPCRMHIYIDGMYQWQAIGSSGRRTSDAVGLDGLIDPRAIAAVEVYPSVTSVPSEFARGGSTDGTHSSLIPSPGRPMRAPRASDDPNAPCGAIVIWTTTHGTPDPQAP